MFIISNVEPFDTLEDAEIAAGKLGDDFEVFEVDEEEDDDFEEEDLDDDEEEDVR